MIIRIIDKEAYENCNSAKSFLKNDKGFYISVQEEDYESLIQDMRDFIKKCDVDKSKSSLLSFNKILIKNHASTFNVDKDFLW